MEEDYTKKQKIIKWLTTRLLLVISATAGSAANFADRIAN
jgi:hypothetical protein